MDFHWRILSLLSSILICHVALCYGDYGGPSGTSKATWYGEAEGDGTDAGACGYGALSQTPYKAIIVAGSSPLFLNGLGCGSCYQVRCVNNPLCASTTVTVVVTDVCPGGDFCGGGKTHFDLSGSAFGALARPGKQNELRNVGVLDISYARAPCPYASSSLSVRILPGFNAFYVGVVPLGGSGPGSVASVAFKQANAAVFTTLTKDWGASSFLLSSSPLVAPFTVRLTASATGEVVTCPKTIPSSFTAGSLYDCGAQFSSGGINSPISPSLPLRSPPPKSPPPKSPLPKSSPPLPKSPHPKSSPPPPKSLPIPKTPPPKSPSSKSPPTGKKVVISQTLIGSYPSNNGKLVVYQYSVTFKNVGDKPVNALTFVAKNFNPVANYNVVSLGGNKYTLPNYAFPLAVRSTFTQFGYHNLGGPAKFTIVKIS